MPGYYNTTLREALLRSENPIVAVNSGGGYLGKLYCASHRWLTAVLASRFTTAQ
jgi:hypothetical protein